jgi:hypothetical protein
MTPTPPKFARENLGNLAEHMKKQGDDIVKFNEFVRQQLDILASRGESTLDLLPNLFRGYKAVEDQAFLCYIEDNETKYDDGEFAHTPEQCQIVCGCALASRTCRIALGCER